ncbi:MAG: hypothetical protein LRY27_01400 [Chitinophagales bacterium]|nr:hypothetical protein [Chitinophagales bacterium]
MKKAIFTPIILLITYHFLLAQNTVYIPLTTENDINGTINTGKAVGAIEAQYEVDNNGGFNYVVPIQIPLAGHGKCL